MVLDTWAKIIINYLFNIFRLIYNIDYIIKWLEEVNVSVQKTGKGQKGRKGRKGQKGRDLKRAVKIHLNLKELARLKLWRNI